MTELEVLAVVAARLGSLGIPYMLTGSFAMAFYAKPRMTRDIDLVLAVGLPDVESLTASLSVDFHIDPDAARTAIAQERMFNLMHYETGLKVDLIVRKSSPYRQVEFDHRRQVRIGNTDVWIVSREDLILSKLDWIRITPSELQRSDVRQLLEEKVDLEYLRLWAPALGVEHLLHEMI